MTFFCCLSDASLASDASRWMNSGGREGGRWERGRVEGGQEEAEEGYSPEQQLSSRSLASVDTRMLGTISLMSLFTTAERRPQNM